MSADVKQVKVDNWGTYFLQRLKHFFNRTDYCDLTLQFQDNAQLKVHRLVLSACTEYFELLERTCEMYEDRLVMPDDLQADVIVPIVNFMYTGHLEFQMDLLERLYQTSLTLNMPVLTKLLESHRKVNAAPKRFYKHTDVNKSLNYKVSTPSTSTKRSYGRAFTTPDSFSQDKKVCRTINKSEPCISTYSTLAVKKPIPTEPRPTRYELPEELDADNVFDNSFTNISYTSKPLVVHPETVKRYSSNKSGFNDSSRSQNINRLSTLDIVECKRVSKTIPIFQDTIFEPSNLSDDREASILYTNFEKETRDTDQLFEKLLDGKEGPKVTLETKDSSLAGSIDHAKIISEVLKKYPHLVKGNKNIKLKILDTPKTKKVKPNSDVKALKPKLEKMESTDADYTYESDVLDSKAAAKLIALGAENVKGPWICLICGTPGKALNFTSYYQFRRHLIEVHNEKVVANMCEHCGLKTIKRNHLHHHLLTHHGITPPPQYHFPKCGKCSYVALTEGYLVKHKLTHKDGTFHCNVCSGSFDTTAQLLKHIQITGHKYTAERKKRNLQCVYCLKVFLREPNLFTHLTTHHKKEAKRDGIVDDSDDEKPHEPVTASYEPSTSYKSTENHYQDQEEPEPEFNIVAKPQAVLTISNHKQKILNTGFGPSKSNQVLKSTMKQNLRNEYLGEEISLNETTTEEIVMIDNDEYTMRDGQLIPRNSSTKVSEEEFILPLLDTSTIEPSTSMDYASIRHNTNDNQQPMIIKKTTNLGQPIQIVVSNEEEYKALMSSNHPIIFDDGDTNKLAVLAAPHDTTLEPNTIDLNDTQSNNMMIIQDNYPINVTEAVADNSNIVVVYSHPVDQNNKQYQIITTQGIGSQFAQSSAIITQNFETVTTSTPVMTDHPLHTQVEHKWPNNVPHAADQLVQMSTKAQIPNIDDRRLEMAVVQKTSNISQNDVNNSISLDTTPMVGQVQEIESNRVNVHTNQIAEEISIIQSDNNEMSTELNKESENTVQDVPITQGNRGIEKVVLENTNTGNVENLVEPTNNISYEETSEQQETIFANNVETEIPETNEIGHNKDVIIENHIVNETEQSEKENDKTENNENQTPIECEEPIDAASQEYSIPIEDQKLIQSLEDSQDATCVPVSDNQPIETPQEYQETVEAENMEEASPPQEYIESVITQTADLEPIETSQTSELSPNETESNTGSAPAATINKEVVKEIETLTSEWSEDEYDVAENDSEPSQHLSKEPEVTQNAEHCEVEESIENIQQEVEKQMAECIKQNSEAKMKALENNAEETKSQADSADKIIESNADTEIDPQQKITSLLNDWEDNDSQEEVSTNDSQDGSTANENGPNSIENTNNNPDPIETLPKDSNPKTDNIRNLVSDWDDEDEEVSKDS